MRVLSASSLLAVLAVTGCMTAEDPRIEGIAFEGGNAIAHNSALQIIDPWPANVQDTDLVVPAERAEAEGDTGDGDADVSLVE